MIKKDKYIAEPEYIEVRKWDGEYHRNGDKITIYKVLLHQGRPHLVVDDHRVEKNCMTDKEMKEFDK